MENENFVTKQNAYEHAVLNLIFNMAMETSGLNLWKETAINQDPIEIYDLNGTLLFYEFSVTKGERTVGRIRASANKALGHTIISLLRGPSKYNFEKSMKNAKVIIEKNFKSYKINSMKIVCYFYPRLGIMIHLKNKEKSVKDQIVIVDAATNQIIPTGKGMWSVYERITKSERSDRKDRWEEDNKLLDLFKEFTEKSKIKFNAKITDELLKKFKAEFLKTDLKLTPVPIKIEKIISLTTYGQQHQCWCAPASGQMLLRYHNYFYQQDRIAQEMSTIPQPNDIPTWNPNQDLCGTYIGPIRMALESLSRNYIDAIVEVLPTWSKAKNEIDSDLPLMSIVCWEGGPCHARVCSGYLRNMVWWVQLGLKLYIQHYLWINDPWPPDSNNVFCNPHGGDEGWEVYDSILHYRDVYLHPCTGTMTCT